MDRPIGITAQVAFATAALGGSWLGMMAVHELGHAVGAWATGGTVTRVVLPAIGFSRTEVQPNPSPGVVVWAGPMVGVLLPIGMWLLACWIRLNGLEKSLRFFAGFCLVINGVYLGLGGFDRVGDVGVMLDTGTPAWVMWLFGGVTVPLGFWLWHGLGPRLGLGEFRNRTVAYAALIGLVLIAGTLEVIARL